MRYIIPVIAIMISLLLIGCSADTSVPDKEDQESPEVTSYDSCSTDDDCICGGIDTQTDRCFMGSKDYYEKHVDKSKDCPDFCGGIEGNLVMRCIDNKCIQIYECLVDKDCEPQEMCINNRCAGATQQADPDAECSSDSDCRTGGCSGQLCEPKSREPMVTTCEFLPEYGCYDDIECGCVDGACSWKEDAAFKDCIEEARR